MKKSVIVAVALMCAASLFVSCDKKSGKNRNKNYITVDKKYITGKCPSASIDLGIKVIETIFSKELSQKVYNAIFGIE